MTINPPAAKTKLFMQIDVGTYIAELLYEHKSVNIPGLGGFTSYYKPANPDQIQGVIRPPSKEIRFNKNLRVNDGVLVNYIREKHKISAQAAQKAVDDYVHQVLQAFERKEMVVFPKVGRLYKDYKGEYEFLPENTNFNPDAYGLPNVQFKPVIRSKEEVQHQAPAAAVKDPTARKKEDEISEKLATWFQKNFPLIISVAVIIIALIIFSLIYESPSKNKTAETDQPKPEVNVSPSGRNSSDTINDTLNSTMEAQEDEEANAAVEEPTTLPGQRSCVIAIGLFGDQNNVRKLVQRIYDAGYEPYVEDRGTLTRVGVQFAYETQEEIDDTLNKIKEEFEEDAVIIKK